MILMVPALCTEEPHQVDETESKHPLRFRFHIVQGVQLDGVILHRCPYFQLLLSVNIAYVSRCINKNVWALLI